MVTLTLILVFAASLPVLLVFWGLLQICQTLRHRQYMQQVAQRQSTHEEHMQQVRKQLTAMREQFYSEEQIAQRYNQLMGYDDND